MINMQILFFIAEIGISKNKNLIFHVIFLNKDISVTTLDITMKFSMTALHIHSVSEIKGAPCTRRAHFHGRVHDF